MSVPPSISKVEIGVVPPDNPAPDPVNWLAVTVPVTSRSADNVASPVTPSVPPTVALPIIPAFSSTSNVST